MEVEYDCPACRRREAMGKLLVEALQSAIDAKQLADIEEQKIENSAWRARAERRDELCEKLTPSIIDALAPLTANAGGRANQHPHWVEDQPHARLQRRDARKRRRYPVLTQCIEDGGRQ